MNREDLKLSERINAPIIGTSILLIVTISHANRIEKDKTDHCSFRIFPPIIIKDFANARTCIDIYEHAIKLPTHAIPIV